MASMGLPAVRRHLLSHTANDNVEQQGGGGLMLILNVTS
jgi:hypothetical protein